MHKQNTNFTFEATNYVGAMRPQHQNMGRKLEKKSQWFGMTEEGEMDYLHDEKLTFLKNKIIDIKEHKSSIGLKKKN